MAAAGLAKTSEATTVAISVCHGLVERETRRRSTWRMAAFIEWNALFTKSPLRLTDGISASRFASAQQPIGSFQANGTQHKHARSINHKIANNGKPTGSGENTIVLVEFVDGNDCDRAE